MWCVIAVDEGSFRLEVSFEEVLLPFLPYSIGKGWGT
jgi:hypothetical protein